jgi:hypothetical protein
MEKNETTYHITEDFDISIHPSVEHAEIDLEVIDIKDGIYTAYDSEGYLLNMSVYNKETQNRFLFINWTSWGECIKIFDNDKKIDRSSELREKLINYLKHSKYKNEVFDRFSLIDLIYKVGKFMPWKV